VNQRTSLVFKGWLALSSDEQRELEAEIRTYRDGSPAKQRDLQESVRKIDLGPLGRGCPCCGR
jgi:hypothetical protein